MGCLRIKDCHRNCNIQQNHVDHAEKHVIYRASIIGCVQAGLYITNNSSVSTNFSAILFAEKIPVQAKRSRQFF